MNSRSQSDSLVRKKVEIPQNKKPILLLDQVSRKGEKSRYFVSTLDCWFHIFDVVEI